MPIETNFVGSSRTKCVLARTFSCIKKMISGKRESVTFDENRRAVGVLNLTSMSDKNEGTYRGREGETPVTTGLSRSLLRVKPPTS